MHRIILLISLLIVGTRGLCDSRSWPPGPTACSDKERKHLFIFDPMLRKDKVVGTNLIYFEYMEQYSALICTMQRSLKFWVEPDYAFMSRKMDHVVVLSEGFVGRPNYAIAVIDADHDRVVWSKTLDDLFPSRKKGYSPRWQGSISTKKWIGNAELVQEGKLLEITTEEPEKSGMQEAALFEKVSVISVDMESFEVSIRNIDNQAPMPRRARGTAAAASSAEATEGKNAPLAPPPGAAGR